MPDYKESTLTGKQWQRAKEIRIYHPVNEIPVIVVSEELAFSVGDQVFAQPVGDMQIAYDPTDSVPRLNPETGEAVGGSVNMQELFVAIYSIYMAKAKERDNQG
jgi:hypothetical protein